MTSRKLPEGLYRRSDSPYIWIRYYDKDEPDKNKRRKSFNTKLEDNPVNIQIAKEIRLKLLAALVDQHYQSVGIEQPKHKMFSEELYKFFRYKNIPPSKTNNLYIVSSKLFIACCSDKPIKDYSLDDYNNFLSYLKKPVLKIRKKKEKIINDKGKLTNRNRTIEYTVYNNRSETTIANYVNHIKTIFNYFVEENHIRKNPIKSLTPPELIVRIIPENELFAILDYFYEKSIDQFAFLYFRLMTGMRTKSVLAQKWENIDFEHGILIAFNNKRKREYMSPMHQDLVEFLKTYHGDRAGNIFNMTESGIRSWWDRGIKILLRDGKIKSKYPLKKFRKALGNILIERNENIEVDDIKNLLDHRDRRVTEGFYLLKRTEQLKEKIDQVSIYNIPKHSNTA